MLVCSKIVNFNIFITFQIFFFLTTNSGKPSGHLRADIEGSKRTLPLGFLISIEEWDASVNPVAVRNWPAVDVKGERCTACFLHLLLDFVPSEFHASSPWVLYGHRSRDWGKQNAWVYIKIMQF